MRTTIELNDELFRLAKEAAATTGRSLRDVVEDALSLALKRPAFTSRIPVDLPESSAAPGLLPGVDLDSSASLLELMEFPDAAP